MNFFSVIGAPKCGTTALWKYLFNHPDISLPSSKESPYFLSNNLREKCWDQHNYIEYPNRNRLYTGSISPQYLCYPLSAKNMYEHFPNAKIIVILRDPIERAHSHYLMTVRRGLEKRTFNEVVLDQIYDSPKRLYSISNVDDLVQEDEVNNYLVHGKYSYLLAQYKKYFEDKNILILSYKEFSDNPHSTLKSIYLFLGVCNKYIPENIGEKFNVGGSNKIQDMLYFLKKIPFIIPFLKKVIPLRQWQKITMKIATMNGNAKKDMSISEKNLELINDYYHDEYTQFGDYFD